MSEKSKSVQLYSAHKSKLISVAQRLDSIDMS